MTRTKLDLFIDFFKSEKAGGFILIGCTMISIVFANSSFSESYLHFWHVPIDLSFYKADLNYSVEHWINDGLMCIFFLLVGLEIERELYIGELSTVKNALLPVIAAVGGMLCPSLIHYLFNAGRDTASGFGIPMATDIAFALGILSLAGNRIPVALKIFLTALAIIDDLGAITVIALFYTKDFQAYYLLASVAIFLLLFIAGKRKVYNIIPYIIGGIIMWYCMLQSGVHASIAGVLLAFAIPFQKESDRGLSYRVQHFLHYPVAYIILPLFALCNTAIVFPSDLSKTLLSYNSVGIISGLIVGKMLGIFGASWLAVKSKIASLSPDIKWDQLLGVAFLGGIGFTMSIFIANLAFSAETIVTASKISVLMASLLSAIIGLLVLMRTKK